jgi:hypothetical protein
MICGPVRTPDEITAPLPATMEIDWVRIYNNGQTTVTLGDGGQPSSPVVVPSPPVVGPTSSNSETPIVASPLLVMPQIPSSPVVDPGQPVAPIPLMIGETQVPAVPVSPVSAPTQIPSRVILPSSIAPIAPVEPPLPDISGISTNPTISPTSIRNIGTAKPKPPTSSPINDDWVVIAPSVNPTAVAELGSSSDNPSDSVSDFGSESSSLLPTSTAEPTTLDDSSDQPTTANGSINRDASDILSSNSGGVVVRYISVYLFSSFFVATLLSTIS